MPGPESIASTSMPSEFPSARLRAATVPLAACRMMFVTASVTAIETRPARVSSNSISRAMRCAAMRHADTWLEALTRKEKPPMGASVRLPAHQRDPRALAHFGLDFELVAEALGSRKAEPQPAAGGEAILQ